MQVITSDRLRDMIAGLKACTAISIETETEPKLLKKGRDTGEPCPYEAIGKIGVMAGLIGVDYSKSVNNQLGREDKNLDFVPHERKWGELMENRMLVRHTNKQGETNYYLQIFVKTADTPIYVWGRTEVQKSEIEEYLPKKSDPKTQDALDKKVVLRDINLNNIRMIRILGEEYIIDNRPSFLDNVMATVEAEREVVIDNREPLPIIEVSNEERSLRNKVEARLSKLIDELSGK